MKQPIVTSPLHVALSALVSLVAGIGMAYVLTQALGRAGWLAVLMTTPAVLFVLLHMLRQAADSAYHQGARSAAVDVATKLPSRAVAWQLLQREFAAAERGRQLTVVLFSLDNLPRLAARHSQDTGKLLLAVGAIFKRRTRGMNLSAPLDEPYLFLSVLAGVDEEGATKFVSKVKKDLATLTVAGQSLNVSTSICGYDPHMHSVDEFIERARAQLTDFDDEEPRLLLA